MRGPRLRDTRQGRTNRRTSLELRFIGGGRTTRTRSLLEDYFSRILHVLTTVWLRELFAEVLGHLKSIGFTSCLASNPIFQDSLVTVVALIFANYSKEISTGHA